MRASPWLTRACQSSLAGASGAVVAGGWTGSMRSRLDVATGGGTIWATRGGPGTVATATGASDGGGATVSGGSAGVSAFAGTVGSAFATAGSFGDGAVSVLATTGAGFSPGISTTGAVADLMGASSGAGGGSTGPAAGRMGRIIRSHTTLTAPRGPTAAAPG